MQVKLKRSLQQVRKVLSLCFFLWLLTFLVAGTWIGVGVIRGYVALGKQDVVGVASAIHSLQPSWTLLQIASMGYCGEWCEELRSASKIAGKFADSARAGSRHYYIWFQNDRELRATGGFLGSYARLDLREGKFDQLMAQDIYVPDGQVKGYVDAPYPLKKFLDQGGGWKLRDANWDPHFARSVESVNWFFEQAGQPPADGVIAINFEYVESLWDVLGTVSVPDVGLLDRTRLYPYLQSEIEENFFPGSTKKSDLMGAITRGFLRGVQDAPLTKKIVLGQRAFSGLSGKDVQLWSKDSLTQQEVLLAGWGGALQNNTANDSQDFVDYLAVNESNLGVNKANCCVERTVEYQVQFEPDGMVTSSVLLDYKNNNPMLPQRPYQYGGKYVNYARVFRDIHWQFVSGQSDADAAENQKFFINQHPEFSLNETAGLFEIPGTKQKQYLWSFSRRSELNFTKNWTYTLRLQKQSGSHTPRIIVRVVFPPGLAVEQSTRAGYSDGGVWTSELTLDRDTDIILHMVPKL